jgi:hypothetical protein
MTRILATGAQGQVVSLQSEQQHFVLQKIYETTEFGGSDDSYSPDRQGYVPNLDGDINYTDRDSSRSSSGA